MGKFCNAPLLPQIAASLQRELAQARGCRIATLGPEKTLHLRFFIGNCEKKGVRPIFMLFPGTDERETRTIRVVPLAEVLEERDILSPALLKLDVQGYELQAFQGRVRGTLVLKRLTIKEMGSI